MSRDKEKKETRRVEATVDKYKKFILLTSMDKKVLKAIREEENQERTLEMLEKDKDKSGINEKTKLTFVESIYEKKGLRLWRKKIG